MMTRPLYSAVWQELAADTAMVFMAGPRQAGKTTLANMAAETYANRVSLNWDVVPDRARLLRNPYFFEGIDRQDSSKPLVVLDEIHKYRNWKNYLKGAYDRFHAEYQFLVTGSGRLDTYRKGGDSLAGRYALFHLWPFTLAELANRRTGLDEFWHDPLAVAPADSTADEIWRRLTQFSGFPEPYLSGKPTKYRRWSMAYHSQLIRQDLRDMTGILAIGDVETLFSLLPGRVGSLLSVTNLAQDLQVAYNTVQSWLDAMERLYLVFSITPWTRRIARATQKARKTYLLDYAVIEDAPARFENMVAVELFRAVQTWNDRGYGPFGLHFVRNKEKAEVDFLVTEKHRPRLLVETKIADARIDKALRTFQDQLGVPAVHLTNEGTTFRRVSNGSHTLLVAPACRWLPRLP